MSITSRTLDAIDLEDSLYGCGELARCGLAGRPMDLYWLEGAAFRAVDEGTNLHEILSMWAGSDSRKNAGPKLLADFLNMFADKQRLKDAGKDGDPRKTLCWNYHRHTSTAERRACKDFFEVYAEVEVREELGTEESDEFGWMNKYHAGWAQEAKESIPRKNNDLRKEAKG